MSLIYPEEAHAIVGCLMEVHREVGPGYDEPAYQLAATSAFRKAGIPCQPQHRIWVVHREQNVVELVPDFTLFDKIVLDLKVLSTKFRPDDIAQVICYLKALGCRLGLLANFGLQSLDVERVPYSPKAGSLEEDFDAIQGLLQGHPRRVFGMVREAIEYVFEAHGIGYTSKVYHKLLCAELAYRRLGVQTDCVVDVRYHGELLRQCDVPVILVDAICPLLLVALHSEVSAGSIARLRTYLRDLRLPAGFAVDFGKEAVHLVGVRASTH